MGQQIRLRLPLIRLLLLTRLTADLLWLPQV
jgi:hypothetical protein